MKTNELLDRLAQKTLDGMTSAWALQEENTNTKAELAQAHQVIDTYKNKIVNLENELAQVNQRNAMQQEKIQEQNKEIQFLTRQKDDTLAELLQKQAEWKDVSGQLTEKIKELGTCREQISGLKSDRERLQSELQAALKQGKSGKTVRPGKKPSQEA